MKQLLLVVLLALNSSAQIAAHAIIERSVQANTQDWNAAPGYDYFERDPQPGGGTKMFEVMMILGSPYYRLVGMDGGEAGDAISGNQNEQVRTQASCNEEEGKNSDILPARIESGQTAHWYRKAAGITRDDRAELFAAELENVGS
jgi:hypothetical protein